MPKVEPVSIPIPVRTENLRSLTVAQIYDWEKLFENRIKVYQNKLLELRRERNRQDDLVALRIIHYTENPATPFDLGKERSQDAQIRKLFAEMGELKTAMAGLTTGLGQLKLQFDETPTIKIINQKRKK